MPVRCGAVEEGQAGVKAREQALSLLFVSRAQGFEVVGLPASFCGGIFGDAGGVVCGDAGDLFGRDGAVLCGICGGPELTDRRPDLRTRGELGALGVQKAQGGLHTSRDLPDLLVGLLEGWGGEGAFDPLAFAGDSVACARFVPLLER